MQTIEYSDFMDYVNDDTKEYILKVFKSCFILNKYSCGVSNDDVSEYLYPFINAYYDMKISNKLNIIKVMATRKIKYHNIDECEFNLDQYYTEDNFASLYTKLDLNIASNEEDIYAITPEDIILYQMEKAHNKFDAYDYSIAVNANALEDIKEINKEKHLQFEDEVEKDNFSDLDYDGINYLRATGSIFAYLRDNANKINIVDPTIDNICVLSVIGGLLKCPPKELKYIYDYIVEKGFDFDEYKKLLNLDFKEKDLNKYDTTMIIDHYFDLYDFEEFFGDNSCFADDIKQDRAVLTMVLGRYGIDVNELIKMREEKRLFEHSAVNVGNCMKNISNDNYDLFTAIFNIYINIKNSGLKVDDIERVSILIGMLSSKNDYLDFFIHNNIKVGDVIHCLGLDTVDLYKNASYDDKDLVPLLKYLPNFEYIDINALLNKNDFLTNYCITHNINYENLQYELFNKQYRALSREEELENFKNLEVNPLVVDSITSITSYGNELSKYNSIITNEMISIPKNISFEELTSALRRIQGVQKSGFLSKLFNKRDEITIDDISEISVLIDSYIDSLNSELHGYDCLRKFIMIYLSKSNEYHKNICGCLESSIMKMNELDTNSIESLPYIEENRTIINILRNKKRTSETSIALMNQELVKIFNMIESHFRTIDALTMAKNDILPLIASEMTINRGIQTQRESMMLSQNLIDLFQSLVDQNIDATKKNLDLLQTSSLPQDVLNKVNMDVTSYIEQVEETQKDNAIGLKLNNKNVSNLT